MKLKNILFSILFVVSSFSINAQEEELALLVTDRPDLTESVAIVPKGALQIETGFGLSEVSPDYFVSAGISWRIPR